VRVVVKALVEPFGERSRVRLSLHFEGLLAGILGFATRKLNNRYLVMEAQALKSRVEGLRNVVQDTAAQNPAGHCE